MFKYGIRIVFISLIIFVHLYPQAKTQKDKQALLALTKKFVNGLYASNINEVKSCLSTKIDIKSYGSEEIKKSVDALILNKISSLDYLNMVTGLNIHKILIGDDAPLKIIHEPKIVEEVYKDMTMYNGKQMDYFFLKVILVLQEQGGANRSFHKSCEIDIFVENGEYKVFGFIL